MNTSKRKLHSSHQYSSPKRHATCPDLDPDFHFQDARSLRQRAEPYKLATAVMPFHALTTVWKQGKSRPVRPHHVARLRNLFLHGGDGKLPGVVREAEENYLLVQSTQEAIQRMRHYLARNQVREARERNGHVSSKSDVLSFLDWALVNGDEKGEVMNGVQRMAAHEDYVVITGSGPNQLWWTCEIYGGESISILL